jgi:hypothetical protein
MINKEDLLSIEDYDSFNKTICIILTKKHMRMIGSDGSDIVVHSVGGVRPFLYRREGECLYDTIHFNYVTGELINNSVFG